MKHRYSISGMTCDACAETVRKALLGHPEVTEVEVRRNPPEATVEMRSHVSSDELSKRVRASGNYDLKTVDEQALAHDSGEGAENTKSWWETYKPVLILAMLLTVASLAVAWQANDDPLAAGMRTFMAGFFFVFGYFKLLDLSAFANAYVGYDLLARRWKGYAYLYPFLELTLGCAYAANFDTLITNSAAILLMGFSSIGVIQSVYLKRRIQCACLGTVFKLPMSTVTIVQDLSMVVMAAAMLAFHYL